LDSLDKVELVMVLEEEFDIEIPTEKFADAVVTIGDICELVQAISIK
jgi:acyl carrier protein